MVFYEWVAGAGIDPEKRTIEQRGDINFSFAFSTSEIIAISVVSPAIKNRLFCLQAVSTESKEEAVSKLEAA